MANDDDDDGNEQQECALTVEQLMAVTERDEVLALFLSAAAAQDDLVRSKLKAMPPSEVLAFLLVSRTRATYAYAADTSGSSGGPGRRASVLASPLPMESRGSRFNGGSSTGGTESDPQAAEDRFFDQEDARIKALMLETIGYSTRYLEKLSESLPINVQARMNKSSYMAPWTPIISNLVSCSREKASNAVFNRSFASIGSVSGRGGGGLGTGGRGGSGGGGPNTFAGFSPRHQLKLQQREFFVPLVERLALVNGGRFGSPGPLTPLGGGGSGSSRSEAIAAARQTSPSVFDGDDAAAPGGGGAGSLSGWQTPPSRTDPRVHPVKIVHFPGNDDANNNGTRGRDDRKKKSFDIHGASLVGGGGSLLPRTGSVREVRVFTSGEELLLCVAQLSAFASNMISSFTLCAMLALSSRIAECNTITQRRERVRRKRRQQRQ